MEKSLEELIREVAEEVSAIEYINIDSIPSIDLYMDQVTTFMEKYLAETKRYESDKILTKTMINNYAKNNLIPPPIKKKYSKEHILFLTFVYYFKNFLSIGDIQKLSEPLMKDFYENKDSEITVSDVYEKIFNTIGNKREYFKASIDRNLALAQSVFDDCDSQHKDYLMLFAFISILSQDVYAKLLVVEKLIDAMDNSEKNK